MRAWRTFALVSAAMIIAIIAVVVVMVDIVEDGADLGPLGTLNLGDDGSGAIPPPTGGIEGAGGFDTADLPEGVSVLVAELDGGAFRITGVVPDDATAERLLTAAFVAYGPSVTSSIEVDPGVEPATWLEGADRGLTLLPMITEGTISVAGDRLELTGSSPNADYLAAFERAAIAAFGVGNVTTNVEITDLSPPRFNARFADGILTLSGELPSEEIRQIIAGGAAAAYGQGSVVDQMTIGDGLYTSYWMYTMPHVFRLLGHFPDYELNVERGVTTGSLNDGANFAYGSAELDEATQALLGVAAAILVRDQSLTVVVEGHTDSTGPQAFNQALSEARAEAAVAYLAAIGIEAERLTSLGYGEEQPIATNETEAGRASNRRVSFAFEQRSLLAIDA